MSAPFLITVNYDGSEQEYKARFERWGYTHRIAVLIGETTVVFEPDEEGVYRALNLDGTTSAVPLGLLEVIAIKLARLIK